MSRALLMIFALVVSAPSLASNPEVNISDDGSITARMIVHAPSDTVRQAVSEIQHTSSGNVLELRFRPDGNCQSVFRKTRGLWSPLTMKTRLCPTREGWREMLVQSDDYTDYESEWTIRDTPSGTTEMAVRVRTSVNLSVPTALVQQGTIDGLKKTFAQITQKLRPARSGD